MAKSLNYRRAYITSEFTGPVPKEFDMATVLHLRQVMQQQLDAMSKRLNEQLFGNWVAALWFGEDGKEYFNWNDLPDKELLRARLTGKYKLGE
jgi:hypothetical protein